MSKQPLLWQLFIYRLGKFFKTRFLLALFGLILILSFIYLQNFNYHHSYSDSNQLKQSQLVNSKVKSGEVDYHPINCDWSDHDFLLKYKRHQQLVGDAERARPTLSRLKSLISILISHEDKFHSIFEYFGIFRFNNIYTFKPFANDTSILNEILCLLNKYITVSDNGHIDIRPELLIYLKQVSIYLSDGFKHFKTQWNLTKSKNYRKPVVVVAANARFYDTLQASMRTIHKFLKTYHVVVYDLGFASEQHEIIKENCESHGNRCTMIKFPFDIIEPISPHIRALENFAWKPLVIQDALKRYGTVIYGDTSVRYKIREFDHLLMDNAIRGFACRELPGHYLPCFTLSDTFSWFNESYSTFNDVYIAEAGFIVVQDNFLSRMIMKAWTTCALDPKCLVPPNSKTKCKQPGVAHGTHRFDQSAMVTVLTFFFYQSQRINDRNEPAPYDMFSSIQQQIAEVRRFEGDSSYFTRKTKTSSTSATNR